MMNAIQKQNEPRYLSRTYRIWCGIRKRCTNPNATGYAYYGGRGISMAPAWAVSFDAFLQDMGMCPQGHVIDRLDVDGNYCAANCRWVTTKQSAQNKRSTRWLTKDGQTESLATWAKITGVRSSTIRMRIDKLGWSVERALIGKEVVVEQI